MTTTTRLITADELIKLPSGQHRYELVKGELLTMSPSGEQHGAVTFNLTLLLGHYVKANNLGRLYGAETGFKLESDPDTVLAPDISFIARERAGDLSRGYRLGPPDLAVEVLSPTDRQSKIDRKTEQWLDLGAKAVWLVDPEKRTIEIHIIGRPPKVFNETEELVDLELIPGLRIVIAEIFN